MIDNESYKYITFASSAQEITNLIMQCLNDYPCNDLVLIDRWNLLSTDEKMKHLIITDMTAGVGGNVLNFSKHFKSVNAIEIEDIRYQYLENNIKLYEYDNINIYHGNSFDLLIEQNSIVQDIIFFDPPWGGTGYKLLTNIRLTFEGITIEEVCRKLLTIERNKVIVLKLPTNYDFKYLFEELKQYRMFKFNINRMTIVIIKNYQDAF